MRDVYDAGAFIAAERGDYAMWRRFAGAVAAGGELVTSTAVVAQVWRANARQARLARVIAAVAQESLTAQAARAISALLARSGTSDIVDAALMLTARDGDRILTSDPDDLAHLARTLRRDVDIIPV
jgi:hypothetical protein